MIGTRPRPVLALAACAGLALTGPAKTGHYLVSQAAHYVLSGAVQDFIDEAKSTDDTDSLSLVRAARAATRDRVEDYIAAATAAGPFVPDTGRKIPEQR